MTSYPMSDLPVHALYIKPLSHVTPLVIRENFGSIRYFIPEGELVCTQLADGVRMWHAKDCPSGDPSFYHDGAYVRGPVVIITPGDPFDIFEEVVVGVTLPDGTRSSGPTAVMRG